MIPSPTAVNRSLLLGSMGSTWLQSPSFSRALLIQLTKATFSSSEDQNQQKKFEQAQLHTETNIWTNQQMGETSNPGPEL